MKKWVFWLSVYIFRLFCTIYFRGRGKGRKNYPKSGPFIIAMNHNSIMDIPAMSYAVDRPVRTMAKDSLFKIPMLRWWLYSAGFFPVRRGAGDRQAMDTALAALKNGGILCMAPEGTRKRKIDSRPKAHTGFIRLAQEVNCPVVPVGVKGARKILPPGAVIPRPFKLDVIVGKPITLEPVGVNPKNQEVLQKQADQVMDEVYRLSDVSYQNDVEATEVENVA